MRSELISTPNNCLKMRQPEQAYEELKHCYQSIIHYRIIADAEYSR